MDEINYKKILLNSYLSICDSASGLKEIGYAKLIFFVLFLENKEIDRDGIKKNTSDYICAKGIPNQSFEAALNLLKSRKLIIENNNKITLTPSEREKTKKQLEYSIQVSGEICNKHFPKSIDQKRLENWFNEVNESYFSAFTDKLIELYNKKKSLILDVEKTLSPIIHKHELNSYKNELIQGYREFLLSSDRKEEEKIWNLMQSLLSAKIVAADISPDFLNINKYKDAEIILDTNVLFANSLTGNKGLDDIVNSFGKIAKIIGAKLYITEETKREYISVCSRKKEEMITLWENYSIDVLKKSNRNDGFLVSLIELECISKEDIERFFSTIQQPPEKIGDSKINIYKHDITYDKIKDQRLFNDIKSAWSEKHEGWEKPESVIIHDLIITKLCQKFISSKKIFALTLDLSMETLSLSWINDKEDPVWRSLYSLVQILAINGGGPNFDPNDLAPLVKIFIEQEELGRSDNYDKRDLLRLTELSDRISELSDTKVISLLNKIHVARMFGNGNPQALKDIKLELERSLIKQSHELNEVISEKEEKISNLQNELNKEKQENIKNRKNKQWVWFAIKTVVKFSLSFLLIIVLGDKLVEQYKLVGLTYDLIQIILFIVSPIYFVIADFNKIREKFK